MSADAAKKRGRQSALSYQGPWSWVEHFGAQVTPGPESRNIITRVFHMNVNSAERDIDLSIQSTEPLKYSGKNEVCLDIHHAHTKARQTFTVASKGQTSKCFRRMHRIPYYLGVADMFKQDTSSTNHTGRMINYLS